MNIFEKLQIIQFQLKAPKAQYNTFGKFKYRSCEDILEAAKPLLSEHGLYLSMTDEVVHTEQRYYIKSTVTAIDSITKEQHSVTAWAREEQAKKGMDESQVTGSSSSYARKYALNGIFGIDDSRDSDTTKGIKDEEETATKTPAAKPIPKENPEFIKSINASKTMQSLKNAYNAIPDEEKGLYIDKVRTRKAILEANEKAEAAKKDAAANKTPAAEKDE